MSSAHRRSMRKFSTGDPNADVVDDPQRKAAGFTDAKGSRCRFRLTHRRPVSGCN